MRTLQPDHIEAKGRGGSPPPSPPPVHTFLGVLLDGVHYRSEPLPRSPVQRAAQRSFPPPAGYDPGAFVGLAERQAKRDREDDPEADAVHECFRTHPLWMKRKDRILAHLDELQVPRPSPRALGGGVV